MPTASASLPRPGAATLPPRDRTVVEGETFRREKAAIEPNARRMDEILDAITWKLARQPESGIEVSPGVWATLTVPWPGAPALAIYYAFDRDRVTLLSVIRSPEPS